MVNAVFLLLFLKSGGFISILLTTFMRAVFTFLHHFLLLPEVTVWLMRFGSVYRIHWFTVKDDPRSCWGSHSETSPCINIRNISTFFMHNFVLLFCLTPLLFCSAFVNYERLITILVSTGKFSGVWNWWLTVLSFLFHYKIAVCHSK